MISLEEDNVDEHCPYSSVSFYTTITDGGSLVVMWLNSPILTKMKTCKDWSGYLSSLWATNILELVPNCFERLLLSFIPSSVTISSTRSESHYVGSDFAMDRSVLWNTFHQLPSRRFDRLSICLPLRFVILQACASSYDNAEVKIVNMFLSIDYFMELLFPISVIK